MESHVVAPAVAQELGRARDELDALIEQARQGLMDQFYLSPDDVKPLILVAIQNLAGLRDTKPSQESLIRALKTVQEMTGMKNEQKLMLGFAEAMWKRPPAPVIDVREKPKELSS
ncbi:MAG: hypothetical protein M3R67_15240 [Acidobacteriota bacterium]|nr:hypothetical protein [Acidobacteriota bacterium]